MSSSCSVCFCSLPFLSNLARVPAQRGPRWEAQYMKWLCPFQEGWRWVCNWSILLITFPICHNCALWQCHCQSLMACILNESAPQTGTGCVLLDNGARCAISYILTDTVAMNCGKWFNAGDINSKLEKQKALWHLKVFTRKNCSKNKMSQTASVPWLVVFVWPLSFSLSN